MKIIIIDNKIISLENILTVELRTFGTGAKSNPYYYNILFEYTDNQEVCSKSFRDEGTAKDWFKKISEKLSENAWQIAQSML